MKDWQRIRQQRHDLTDYVVHLTKATCRQVDGKYVTRTGRQVLKQILEDGHIKATFAPYRNKDDQRTVRGPDPAVCLTEQPLWCSSRASTSFRVATPDTASPTTRCRCTSGEEGQSSTA